MHVFSKNAVNTSVLEEAVQKHVKYTFSDMLWCQSVANSGVFATFEFFGRCKNIVNTNVLA